MFQEGTAVRHQFFPRRFAPRPCLVLKFGHMIDIAYIYKVSKFQQQTRSRSKNVWGKNVVYTLYYTRQAAGPWYSGCGVGLPCKEGREEEHSVNPVNMLSIVESKDSCSPLVFRLQSIFAMLRAGKRSSEHSETPVKMWYTVQYKAGCSPLVFRLQKFLDATP